jgi:hypothetical protein
VSNGEVIDEQWIGKDLEGSLLTYQRNVLPPSSGSKIKPSKEESSKQSTLLAACSFSWLNHWTWRWRQCYFFIIIRSMGETEFIWDTGHYWAYCTSPGWWQMSVEQLVEWKLAKETKVLGESLHQYRFVHHKSYMSWPGIEPGWLWWKAGGWLPELWHGQGNTFFWNVINFYQTTGHYIPDDSTLHNHCHVILICHKFILVFSICFQSKIQELTMKWSPPYPSCTEEWAAQTGTNETLCWCEDVK